MGTSGNSDGRPDNGGPHDELSGLPPEWGSIVIPDDPSELAAEAALVRRELRQLHRRRVWRRRLGLAPAAGGPARPALRLPLLIMAVALLATLTSLFAVIWPGQQRQPAVPRTASSGTQGRTLPTLNLVGENGEPVPLRTLLPAVIIFVDSCTCADQVAAAVRAVPTGVRVVTVVTGVSAPPKPGESGAAQSPGATPGTGPVAGPAVPRPGISDAAGVRRSLADPASGLRGFFPAVPRPGTAPAVLAARSGRVLRLVPTAGDVAEYPSELSQLASR
ncbi:hypothetical protein AB0J86_11455 [Micromonospora sp. NPDC049559]|uniref:hypothetical protein n=1 Tax=Micromonospora sp. NPDC049559 TaxID=3155923 RepID=UPI0034404917